MEPRANLILANRAYMDHDVPPGGDAPVSASSGGLLAAVRPVIAPWDGSSGTTWIGAGRGQFDRDWTDAKGYELIRTPHGPLRHRRLYFDAVTWNRAYAGVANCFFWPLLHLVREPLPARVSYYPAPAMPTASDWSAYQALNEAFADAAMGEANREGAWAHDYHLGLTPALMRERRFAGPIGFFLHTPFPDVDVVEPYIEGNARDYFAAFIRGMLGADLIGLQSSADEERFCRAASRFGAAHHRTGGGVTTEDGRVVQVRAFPVGIDCDELEEVAAKAELPSLMPDLPPSVPLVVGLERSDYTKGIPERLAVLERAYTEGLRFAYVGVAAPTRQGIEAYSELEDAIGVVAERAAMAAGKAHLPFVHSHAVIGWPEVVALQRAASVVFTSSLADGLNLVPLQSAIAQSSRPPAERAVLLVGRDAGVASAFAGFAADGLVPVDPLDADGLYRSFTDALAGRPGRVSDRLIESVRHHDARSWGTRFLTALENAC